MRSRVLSASGCFADAGNETFENAFSQLLRFAELRQIFLEVAIQIESGGGFELVAQNHVAQMDRMREHGVIAQFFESCSGIIVIHNFLPANANIWHWSV